MILTGRVKRVNVQTQVDWILGANSVANLLDDSINANGIDLSRLHNLEAAVSVVLVIGRSTQRRADAGVDVGVILQQTLLRSMVEVGAVVNASDLGRGAAKYFWSPWCNLAFQYLHSSHSNARDEHRLSEERKKRYLQVSKWLSKWITEMGPYARLIDRSSGRVMVWSPPSVMTRGSVLPFFEGPSLSASVAGARERIL